MAEQKDPARVAAGLKATMKNPRVSEEAKESAKERLQSTDESPETLPPGQQEETIDGKNAGNVLRGYKAALNNPNVSEKAKQKAEHILEEHDA